MGDPKLFGNLFLGIGAMKAGTTWLYAVLDRHPHLHFTPEKEIHYFYHRYVEAGVLSEPARLRNAKERYLQGFDSEHANIDRIRQTLHWVSAYLTNPVDDHWYAGLFQRRRHHRYACDFSNLTAHIPAEAWQRISGSCRKLRVIYTMRDPLSRLWSHVKFHLQITGQLDRLETWEPEECRAYAMQPFIWINGEYGAVLRRLREGLERSQWMPLFYEDIHADERAAIARIEDFLELNHHTYPAEVLRGRPTQSARHAMPDWFPDLFADDMTRIHDEVRTEGLTLPDAWRTTAPRQAAG